MKRLSIWTCASLWLLFFCLATAGWAQSMTPGTEIKVRLLDQLDTGETQAGQQFSATVAEPVRSGDRTVLARGTKVNGRVVEVVSSGRLKRPASITLELTGIGSRSVKTETVQIDGKSHAARNVALIGGGAAVGTVLGAIAGGGKGAAIGTAVGAGAGTGTAYMTGKQEIVLPRETVVTFVVAGKTPPAAVAVAEPDPPARAVSSEPVMWHGDRREFDQDAYDSLIFSEYDQRMIRSYFYSNRRNLPPGLAKRDGDLPPGLERRLRRDGTLPPGLQRRVEPFPWELNRRLPRLPEGYSRVVIAGRALIVADNGRIVDLMFIYR
jgi:hypothetical protein